VISIGVVGQAAVKKERSSEVAAGHIGIKADENLTKLNLKSY
jgi:hypothetical protein